MADKQPEEDAPAPSQTSSEDPIRNPMNEPDEKKGGNPLNSYGNAVGDKISDTLSPVGKPVGKGLETIGKPIGGILEPLVGGVLKGGNAWGETLGVGAGNLEHKKQYEEEERKAPVGGEEQTADNPLGLN
ncbi:MAG: hypothetical protein MMC33_009276 [Icmadophila ericetorum]|nr:hypothetical protein [Icmadophila ericetorum]